MPLSVAARSFFEPRFGADFSGVRVHADASAAELAAGVNARAFTVGRDVFFGAGEFRPGTSEGDRLLAHELTHTAQQGAVATLRREPVFPTSDPTASSEATRAGGSLTSCSGVEDNIREAWPTARAWVQHAISELNDPSSVSGELQRNFRVDPDDPTHAPELATLRQRFQSIADIMDRPVNIFCTPPNQNDRCRLNDGSAYGAFVWSAVRSDNHMFMCTSGSATSGFMGRADLMDLIIHEIAHNVDPAVDDWAYRHSAGQTTWGQLTRQQAVDNADSYAQFAKDLYLSGPARGSVQLDLTTGALLSSGDPLWAVRARYSLRTRTGLEVFDLAGGVSFFIGLDPTAQPETAVRDLGVGLDIGVLSRSAETHFFADTRVGAFFSGDVQVPDRERAGISVSSLIGWADNNFRAGVDMQMLFDFLNQNHALLIGGSFGVEF